MPHFRLFHQSAHIAYFFPHKLAFSTVLLTLFVFLLPIFLLGFVTSAKYRMAPCTCPDPCGTKWGSWFQAILCHIRVYKARPAACITYFHLRRTAVVCVRLELRSRLRPSHRLRQYNFCKKNSSIPRCDACHFS